MRRRAAHLRALCVLALAAGTAPSPGDGPVSAAAGGSRERAPPTVIAVDAHDVVPGGHDSTRALRVLLEGLTRQRRRTRAGASVHLVFRNGVYHFWPHHAHEEHVLYVANNDEGRRRIALHLAGVDRLVVEGNGATFVFHGYITPFNIANATKVVVKDLAVDYHRTFHTEALVHGYAAGGAEVSINATRFPHSVRKIPGAGQHHMVLQFTDHPAEEEHRPYPTNEGAVFGSNHILEFDTRLREPAAGAVDYYFDRGLLGYPVKRLRSGHLRLLLPHVKATAGNTLVFYPNHRKAPAFIVSDSDNVRIQNVTIHHAGGMGVVGQRNHNMIVTGCRITPSHGRMASTTADATHFVAHTGKLVLSHNLFEMQGDDASNIHGIYLRVVQLDRAQRRVWVQYAFGVVGGVAHVNKELTEHVKQRLVFRGALPTLLTVGDVIAEVRAYPSVSIVNNTIRNNRARGLLLNTRGRTVVANNYFHTSGTAILFESDAGHWFEQGGTRDCKIRGNVFDRCNYMTHSFWGDAVIGVSPGVTASTSSRYNRGITIKQNKFVVFDEGRFLLKAKFVDGLAWTGNTVRPYTGATRAHAHSHARPHAYTKRPGALPRVSVEFSNSVCIDAKCANGTATGGRGNSA